MVDTDVELFPEPFGTELRPHGTTVVVVASGEIDLNCCDRLHAELRRLLSDFRRIVLDLRDVDFIDCSGLHCLLDVNRASREAGVEFELVRGPKQVQRLFEVAHADDVLRFIDPNRA